MRSIFTLMVIVSISVGAYASLNATTAPLKPGQGEHGSPMLGNLDCSAAIAAPCPGVVTGQTIEHPNNVNAWQCGFLDPGGEIVYALTLETVIDLTVTIVEHNEGCIDVYFVNQCDEVPCTWIGATAGDSRMIHEVGPGTVYVIVDRWIGCVPNSYDFQLEFECSEPPVICNYVEQCTEDLGRLNWYADGEWSSRDGLIYQVYRGGFLPSAPDIIVYDPQTCDIVRTIQLGFTMASQRGIAVDTRNGNIWIAGWWSKVIYYVDETGELIYSFANGPSYAGLAYDADNERLWAVTNNAPDKYLVFDVQNPLEPALLWGPTPMPWQGGGTFFGTNFNGAGLEYNPYADMLIFINQDAATQECFHDNGDGTLMPMGCCKLASLQTPWGCALIDGGLGERGALYVTSLDEWPFGPWPVEVFATVCDAPLPVELSSFQAIGRDGYIALEWTTASENDNDHFIIYRRQPGTNWTKIAEVQSKGNGTTSRRYTHADYNVRIYEVYEYMLADVDMSGIETKASDKICQATVTQLAGLKDFALHQNYPNPFNPETTIRYDVGKAGLVHLQVFDVTGRLISTLVDKYISEGSHSITFDGSDLPSGIYLVAMGAENFRAVTKIVLTK